MEIMGLHQSKKNGMYGSLCSIFFLVFNESILVIEGTFPFVIIHNYIVIILMISILFFYNVLKILLYFNFII